MEVKREIEWDDYEYDDDGNEIEVTRVTRRMLVVPGCCEESIRALRPYLYLNFGPIDTAEPENIDDAVPEWRVPHHDYYEVTSKFIENEYDENYNNVSYEATCVPVKFCPYCGTKMPKVRRKANPPTPVYSDADGGYYCGTCDERNRSCNCWPRTALFEVVGGE